MSSRSDEFLVLDLRRTHLILLSRILTVDFTWMSFYQVKEASFCSQFANFFGGGWWRVGRRVLGGAGRGRVDVDMDVSWEELDFILRFSSLNIFFVLQ